MEPELEEEPRWGRILWLGRDVDRLTEAEESLARERCWEESGQAALL